MEKIVKIFSLSEEELTEENITLILGDLMKHLNVNKKGWKLF